VTTFEAPRGTHDILPSEQPLWRLVVSEAERLCSLYGYRPIQTPVFEDTALFARTAGEGSDVVQKEMYTFEDRGGRSLTLRPEATAPIARAYLEHGLHREGQPVKLYTIGTMYRYAAPQRGRYREHWQLSVEAIGSADPAIDVARSRLIRGDHVCPIQFVIEPLHEFQVAVATRIDQVATGVRNDLGPVTAIMQALRVHVLPGHPGQMPSLALA